jgi:hypothetical protein
MSKYPKYPEQSPYVNGDKVCLRIDEDRNLVINAQARHNLKFYGVDEAKFIAKLKELFLECFSNLQSEYMRKDHVYNFEHCYVGKATFEHERDEDGECPHFKIEIFECAGRAIQDKKDEGQTK